MGLVSQVLAGEALLPAAMALAQEIAQHSGHALRLTKRLLREGGDPEPMTLERVELLDVDPGLQLIGVIVVEPDGRHPLVGSARGYPPSEPGGTTRRVQGYRLEPAESNADFVQILVGLRLRASHRAGARKIAVDYRVGEAQYRDFFTSGGRHVTPYAIAVGIVGMISSEVSISLGLRGKVVATHTIAPQLTADG